MPTMPTSALEVADGKPIHTTELPPPDRADIQKGATITKLFPEPIHDQVKPSTPTTSEEDASGGFPPKKAANNTTSENLDSTSQTTKELAGCRTVEGSGDTEDPTVGSMDANVDQRHSEKIKQGEGEKNSNRGEIGDGNTQDENDKISSKEETSDDVTQDEDDIDDEISEEEDPAYSTEGQELCNKRAPKHIKQFGQYFRTVEYRMTFLEEELKKLRGNDLGHKPKDDTGEKSAKPTESPKVIPSIRRLNWVDYRPPLNAQEASELRISQTSQRSTWAGLKVRLNLQKEGEPEFARTSGDQRDVTPCATTKQQHHVLEVLIEDPRINKRRQVRNHTDDETIKTSSSRDAGTYQKSDAITTRTSKTTLQCPERVRICSKPLLAILRNIMSPEGPEWNIPHMVFLRPFKLFVLYEIEIRDTLKDLEKKWQSKEQHLPPKKASERKPKEQHGEANKSIGEEDKKNEKDETTSLDAKANIVVKTDTFEALAHLRLLVEFLDNDLKSTFALRKRINLKETCPIAFADLWHLYEHGQEVRTPDDKLQVFKVARFTGGRDLLRETLPPDTPEVPVSCIEREESNGAFFLECYRYDFNGNQYGPVHNMFEIRRYEGLRDITSLQVYPLCFDPEYKKKRAQLVQRGEKFMALARVNETAHKTYCGLSLDEHAEEIESPIVVDFQLAISKGKIRIPSIGFQSRLYYDLRETSEDYYACGFEGCEHYDEFFWDHRLDYQLSERFLADQKPHIAPVEDPEELGEDERILLPCSVHGFVLRSRKWRTFNIDDVDDMKYSSGFDDLVLPPGHKETVEALVKRHSRGTETIGIRTEVKSSMDLVTGKGKGLIILLHGAPGVGKTSTAECVADKTERPLFPITCGDLGESAIEVEESLERNFSLAHRWGCVLLLDEADVFLTLRNQTDLRRNAVVSVFLRTLEYYSGILFLTTNRVGTLDPAFKSRIHISLYYPKLGRKASSEIWRNHIEKAKDYFEKKGGNFAVRKREIIEFSKQHFKNLKDEKAEPWNGRQIRNAFQTAIALAEHEAYLSGGRSELTERHFAKVSKASSDFDWYLKMTHGRSESQLAEANKIRTDDPEKAATKIAAMAQRQRPQGQPKLKDNSSDTDSSEDNSSDADDTSSSEETPPPKASKKTKKKQRTPPEDEAPPKKSKKERAKHESASEEEPPARRKSKTERLKESVSEEETPPTKKTKKEKAKQESSSGDEGLSTKKGRKEKEGKKKKKEPSSDEDDQESSEEVKEVKKSGNESKGKGKEKAKSTSKSFN